MGVLRQARKPNNQICRLVNGPARGRQGNDFQAWSRAEWDPCSNFRRHTCHSTDDGPPVTWRIGAPPAGDNRNVSQSAGSHFLGKYGFDSQTAGSICCATADMGKGVTSTVSDHGFRALNNDPLFTNRAYSWPLQDYQSNPTKNGVVLPHDIASANWQKRQVVQSVLAGDLPEAALRDDDDDDDGEKSVKCSACDIVIYYDTEEVIYFEDSDMIPVEQIATMVELVVSPTSTVPEETAPIVFGVPGGLRNAAL